MPPATLADAKRLLDAHPARAAEVARGLVAAAPGAVEPCFVLAAALRRSGDPAAALTVLAPLAAALPGLWGVQYEHGMTLAALGQDEAAASALDRAAALNPQSSLAAQGRAAIRMQLGDVETAVADYAVALALSPNDPGIWVGSGHALRAVGRQAEAVAAYRRAVDLRPGFGEAWWSLADLKAWRFAPGDTKRMIAARDGATDDDRAYLNFALGKAREDEGAYADAFDHYAQGNAARGAATPHDAEAASGFVDRSIATFTPAFFAARAETGASAADPIFIVGMPRSGSTLVEQILASHSAVEGLSELADLPAVALGSGLPYPETVAALDADALTAMGEDYLARTRVRRRLGRPRFIDKFPGNVLHVGLIQLILPNARIVDVRRDPLPCCVSLWKQAFARGQAYSYDLGDLGRTYADYVRLTAHFDRVLPGSVHTIAYEALVEDPESQVRRLLDHLGLVFEPACLRFFETARVVRTPSSEQVRRPINRDGLDQWRHFEPWLGPLKTALGPLAGSR